MTHDLGDFLRARRTDPALSPPGVAGRRRRVTGLRREEVAAASGVSVDYYTRLEQGRETSPSDAVLDALARTLRLTPDATAHLSRLRHPSASDARRPRTDAAETAARMSALVAAVRPHAAYVLDRLSTVVAANPEGLALFEGFADLDPVERNTCRYLVCDPRARRTFVEWEDLARGAVAHLRAAHTDDLRDPRLVRFVAELSASSPLFTGWWEGHLVERRRTAVAHLRMPGGEVALRHEVLYLPEDGMRMTLWLPAGEPAR